MSDTTLEQRVERLEAYRAIDSLIGNLGRAFDSGPSVAALLELFTEDATFVIDRYDTLHGREAIASEVAGNAQTGFRWTLHYLVSPRVNLDQDNSIADVQFYLWEVATAASGKAYWIGGTYDSRAVLTPEGWKFERLELKADLISHYAEGWQNKPDLLSET